MKQYNIYLKLFSWTSGKSIGSCFLVLYQLIQLTKIQPQNLNNKRYTWTHGRMSVQNYLESAQTCYFLTRNLQKRIFFNFLARIRQSFFLQILYVIIAISVHNSAQNIIKLCFDRAKKSTFRMSDKYEESQSTPAFAVTFECF